MQKKKENVYGFVLDQIKCNIYLLWNLDQYCRIDTRNSFAKLKNPFARLTPDRKPYRILVPLCRTIYPNSLNTFKHCHCDYLGLALNINHHYYPQYYFTILFLTNPV